MINKEKQNCLTEYSLIEKEKMPNNYPPIINKEPVEARENYNILNIPNYEMDNFKSASKIYKHTNPSK